MSSEVDNLKQRGNDAMKNCRYDEAVKLYSDAIELEPGNHVLYSNRSAAYSKQECYVDALQDAESTIRIKKDWPKGYSRKGTALFKLDRLKEAEEAFKEGLQLDPDNVLMKEGLEEVLRKTDMPNPFTDPMAEFKLRANPKTRPYLDDPDFVAKFYQLKKNPQSMMSMMGDKRIMEAICAILEVDLTNMGGRKDPLVQRESKDPPSPHMTGGDGSYCKGAGEPMETESELSPEDKQKKKALEEKEKGNIAYKMKDFPSAIAHYDKAYELDSTNVTFLTNKAAVYFELQDWDNCVKLCEEAVERGRAVRADFKVIAKALARIGNVHLKMERYQLAIKYFDKSVAEHRSQDIVKKKLEAEKKLKEMDRLAYFDPAKSLEEKEKGNDLFKKGEFPDAIKCYTEAIRRNPRDCKLYSNRAACFQKILEFQLAIKDCEECINLDPKFVKGYIRKGHALLAMKDLSKARQAFQTAVDLDPNSAEARDGVTQCFVQDDPESRRKAAMHDPEVQAILNDPAMQLILQQMQSQPEALRDHLKNPKIASNIQKLLDSGFISLR